MDKEFSKTGSMKKSHGVGNSWVSDEHIEAARGSQLGKLLGSYKIPKSIM